MGVSPYRLCLPSAFGERAGFDVDAGHIFSQGVQTAVTLVGGVAGAGGTRACTGREAWLCLCLATVTVLPGTGSDPTLLEQQP